MVVEKKKAWKWILKAQKPETNKTMPQDSWSLWWAQSSQLNGVGYIRAYKRLSEGREWVEQAVPGEAKP